jgi:hypothetical protein
VNAPATAAANEATWEVSDRSRLCASAAVNSTAAFGAMLEVSKVLSADAAAEALLSSTSTSMMTSVVELG